MLRVYVENPVGRPETYRIGQERLAQALRSDSTQIEFNICDSDQPDLEALAKADVFVGSGFDVERLRKYGTSLRLVHCTSAGIERYLPLDWLPAGAKLTNSSGIHTQKAKEYAAMALLMLNVGMPKFMLDQAQRRWDPQLTTGISEKSALVVGLGRLGCAAAAAACELGLKVEGISRHGKRVDGIPAVYPIGRLQERIRHCDFLILCCPLTEETRGLIGAKVLANMRTGAGLVNMARGPVVQTEDLLAALRSGHLSGAVLDVFDAEPLPGHAALWDAPNLIITPHISCDVPTGYADKSLRILARNTARLLAGEVELENEISPSLGY